MESRVLLLMWWFTYGLWKLQCRLNRPVLPSARKAEPASPWVLGQPWLRGEVNLLVAITTHRRSRSCIRLLNQLSKELDGCPTRSWAVAVLNDPSEDDYSGVAQAGKQLLGPRFRLWTAQTHLGKAGFHHTYQAIFELALASGARTCLFLQDDVELETGFFPRAWTLWTGLGDRRCVLSLVSMAEDEPRGRWITFSRQPLAEVAVWRTQWFDLQAFMVDRRFFEMLGGRVFPPDPYRFRHDPSRSSGMGEQFTRRLWRRADIHQVVETLAFHGGEASQMNPEARERAPLDNRPEVRPVHRSSGADS